jgi:hypothetical protein
MKHPWHDELAHAIAGFLPLLLLLLGIILAGGR